MKTLPLDITDLIPQNSEFEMQDSLPGVKLTLAKWSVLKKEWAISKYGSPQAVQAIFTQLKLVEICDLAWHLMKEESKKHFVDEKGEPSRDVFLDSISSIRDQIALQKAMLKTVGIGEPEFEKIEKDIKREEAAGTVDPNA